MNPRVALSIAVAFVLIMELAAAFMVGVPLWAVLVATFVFALAFWMIRRRRKAKDAGSIDAPASRSSPTPK